MALIILKVTAILVTIGVAIQTVLLAIALGQHLGWW